MAHAQMPASSTTCFSKDDIVEAITDNARNNFNKVIGLPYFCGGSESSPSVPNLKCITSAHSWIVDIENRTRTNWDDEGRIELAKQYALDSAYTHINHCATKHKLDWANVKKAFLEIYPEDRSLPSLMHELSSVTRRPRETLTELYIRIEGIVEQLEALKPTGKDVYSDMFVSIIINALPKDFSYILTEVDMKIPLTVYKKALKYVASHPNLQLTDVAIRKEMSKGIPVNSITPQEAPVYQTLTGKNKTYCQRCGLNNHDTQHCRASECFRCHRFGHTSRYCKIQIPQWRRPAVTCFSCGMFGHTNRQCRNVPWYLPQGKSINFVKKKTPIHHW